MFSTLLRLGLGALAGALREMPKNDSAFTYDIIGFDKSQYLTRTLLPRFGARRVILHKIHRPDFDRHLHNHPWKRATFVILTGGYIEERLVSILQPRDGLPIFENEETSLTPGMVNHIHEEDYHRITHVEPNTWTLGFLGERHGKEWGFLMDDGKHVHWRDYFATMNHAQDVGSSLS